MMKRQGTPTTTAVKVEVDWPSAPKLKDEGDQSAINDYHEQMRVVMQRKLESLAKVIPVADTPKKG